MRGRLAKERTQEKRRKGRGGRVGASLWEKGGERRRCERHAKGSIGRWGHSDYVHGSRAAGWLTTWTRRRRKTRKSRKRENEKTRKLTRRRLGGAGRIVISLPLAPALAFTLYLHCTYSVQDHASVCMCVHLGTSMCTFMHFVCLLFAFPGVANRKESTGNPAQNRIDRASVPCGSHRFLTQGCYLHVIELLK